MKILIVRKQTILSIFKKSNSKHVENYLKKDKSLQNQEKVQNSNFEKLETLLKKEKIEYKTILRGDKITKKELKTFKLIINFGGDGTFLNTARRLGRRGIPILGINANPEVSMGFFCKHTISDLPKLIKNFKENKVKTEILAQLEITISHKKKKFYALNDCLIAHKNPAAMSRYTIDKHFYKSSGILISTFSGKTAWIYNEGGSLDQKKDELQYLHRGLRNAKPKFAKKLKIHSDSKDLYIFLDGEQQMHKFPIGENVEIRVCEELKVVE